MNNTIVMYDKFQANKKINDFLLVEFFIQHSERSIMLKSPMSTFFIHGILYFYPVLP